MKGSEWACKQCGGTEKYPSGGCKRCAIKRSQKNREKNPGKYSELNRIYQSRKRKEQPEKVYGQYLKCVYGISVEDYRALLDKQSGACAGCGDSQNKGHKFFCVDHDHLTGEIRGLLCHRCNVVLGLVKDNPGLLGRLALYLEES